MPERKNIFLIGRQGHRGDENQLTEMLAFLWQEQPELVGAWFDSLGIGAEGDPWLVETQFVLPSGKRPDLLIENDRAVVLVESKLGAALDQGQIAEYLTYLAQQVDRRCTLVVLTQQPEQVDSGLLHSAAQSGVHLIPTRWQTLAETLGGIGSDSLSGDFVQMLVRERLVTPARVSQDDWMAWNRGYEVLLRLEALLDEATSRVESLLPSLMTSSNGRTKRWVYRLWKSDEAQVGLGFGAAYSDNKPDGEPIIFSQAFYRARSRDQAREAIGNARWSAIPGAPPGAYGLLWGEWPTRSQDAAEVLLAPDFHGQVDEALTFVVETVRFLQGVGYLPAGLLAEGP